MDSLCFTGVLFKNHFQFQSTFIHHAQTDRCSLASRPTNKRRRPIISMDWKPAGLLKEAIEIKKLEVEMMEQVFLERPDHPVNMRRSFYASTTLHRFSKSLRRSDGTLAVVAAIKRFQAPYPGQKAELLAPLNDISLEARKMEINGVDAALVYTDTIRFGVETLDMNQIAKALKFSTSHFGMPLARQDLIVDPIQIAEAAEEGACAVTLIASAILPDLLELLNAATAMGLEAVVECHTAMERDLAMECGATIIFLNDWDRTQNKLVPGSATRLIDEIPPWVLTLGGGGLVTASDCWNLLDAGFTGVVLGKSLLQSNRPAGFIREIRSQQRHSGNIFTGNMGTPFSGDSFN